jgi:hypothetical protein
MSLLDEHLYRLDRQFVLVNRYKNVIVDFSIQSALPEFIERLTYFDSTRNSMSYVQEHCNNP